MHFSRGLMQKRAGWKMQDNNELNEFRGSGAKKFTKNTWRIGKKGIYLQTQIGAVA